MAVRIYKSPDYHPKDMVGMKNVTIETFDSRDEGAKRYAELLNQALRNPFSTEWKFLCIDMEGFSTIERSIDCISYSGAGLVTMGVYRASPVVHYPHANVGK